MTRGAVKTASKIGVPLSVIAAVLSWLYSCGLPQPEKLELWESNPPANETIASLDGEVELLFGKFIVMDGSKVQVIDPKGRNVVSHLEVYKRLLLVAHLKSPNAPHGFDMGDYAVLWVAKGEAGQTASGSFKFHNHPPGRHHGLGG